MGNAAVYRLSSLNQSSNFGIFMAYKMRLNFAKKNYFFDKVIDNRTSFE